MARSIPVIYQQLLAAKNAQANLSALNSNSQVSTWNLWLWIVAVGQNVFEQLCDLFTTNIEAQIINAPVFSPGWIQWMIFQFQYSVSLPQYRALNLTTFSIAYPAVNASLLAISQASIQVITNRSLYILVASGSPPTQTSSAILAALQSDMNEWMIPGTEFILASFNADQIYIQAQVYYDANYSGVIQANMDTAIAAYLAGINFAGVFSVGELYDTMMGVTGVTNVVLNNVYWRKATDPVPSANPPTNENPLVVANTWENSTYQMFAGYAVVEQTAGFTPDDQITYIPS